jgi:hypothetical protein
MVVAEISSFIPNWIWSAIEEALILIVAAVLVYLLLDYVLIRSSRHS